MVFVRARRARTGRHTGRSSIGSRTTIPTRTQVLPNPTVVGPVAEPSWNQPAAQTFFPDRWNKVSSMATVTAPVGTRRVTTRRARAKPSCSGDQTAWEKNRWAR